jgi:hypothetical protein
MVMHENGTCPVCREHNNSREGLRFHGTSKKFQGIPGLRFIFGNPKRTITIKIA